MCACVKHNGDTWEGWNVVNGVISCLWHGYDEKIMFCVYRVEKKCSLQMGWKNEIKGETYWELFKKYKQVGEPYKYFQEHNFFLVSIVYLVSFIFNCYLLYYLSDFNI